MSLWGLVVSGWQHARVFGHWPDWQSFNGWLVCERCLKPPKLRRRLMSVREPVRGTMGL